MCIVDVQASLFISFCIYTTQSSVMVELLRIQYKTVRVAYTIREESSQTNVILQYKLLAAMFSAVCSVIQQS